MTELSFGFDWSFLELKMSPWLISQTPDLHVNITYGVFQLPITHCVWTEYTLMQETVHLLWDDMSSEVTFLALDISEWNKVSLGWWVVSRSTNFSRLNLSIKSFFQVWGSKSFQYLIKKLNREIFLCNTSFIRLLSSQSSWSHRFKVWNCSTNFSLYWVTSLLYF